MLKGLPWGENSFMRFIAVFKGAVTFRREQTPAAIIKTEPTVTRTGISAIRVSVEINPATSRYSAAAWIVLPEKSPHPRKIRHLRSNLDRDARRKITKVIVPAATIATRFKMVDLALSPTPPERVIMSRALWSPTSLRAS